ncbi:RNA 2',3'-cyclic phosphodiesterase [Anoxybacteroides amylolyticum]|uniref:RNA 2',3'-cyclic phosphodiesterase n=1 Tax=Anoxybacteroides amylolyticum TaxID=294699 RepID=A0A167TTA4_9BACL|nr:RNA 2',3'-cyclic phosphodiesterase [Anoxybacillus amylolyticus]ANB62250.1 2'-5' RNA ligase [Anoxybacillus amylolyticus]
MKKTHYFLAVPITDEIKQKIANWCEKAAPRFPFRTWVHKDDYHLTLVFLGAVSAQQLQAVKEKMAAICNNYSPFSITLKGIGTFGVPSSPRILWQGIERTELLWSLRHDIYEACRTLGFSLDPRPFAPHMTLARKWQGEKPFAFMELPDVVEGHVLVHEVVLYQTHLDRVPKYEAIASFPLRHRWEENNLRGHESWGN